MSAGYICAKGWPGKTRFDPSGIKTDFREYAHAPSATLLEDRRAQSGAHVFGRGEGGGFSRRTGRRSNLLRHLKVVRQYKFKALSANDE